MANGWIRESATLPEERKLLALLDGRPRWPSEADGLDTTKKETPSFGLLTQNVRPVVLSQGLLSHLWSVNGCTLSSKTFTGMAEVLVIDGVCKCALVLKSLRDISTNGLFPGSVVF